MNLGFQGYMRQSVARNFLISLYDPNNGTVVIPDALPTFRIYGPSGFVFNGTSSNTESGVITGATNANPIVITAVAHNLTTGAIVSVASVLGNTNANGVRQITRLTADTFSLNGIAGNAAYTSGGTWVTAGLITVAVNLSHSFMFDVGGVYTAVVSFTVSGVPRVVSFTFGVN